MGVFDGDLNLDFNQQQNSNDLFPNFQSQVPTALNFDQFSPQQGLGGIGNLGLNLGLPSDGELDKIFGQANQPQQAGFLDAFKTPEGFKSIIGGLSSLAGLYGGIKGLGLSRDQFNLSKDFANTNLNNSVQEYNNTLEHNARARAGSTNQSQASVDDYLASHKINR